MAPTPLPEALGPALEYLDMAGIFVFAISGALLAAEKKLTIVTFFFFALVTGVGGGTVRDLLIGAPVFWVQHNLYLLICLAAGLVVWLLPVRIWPARALLWFDAAGLSAYSAFGAAKALAFDIAPLPAVAMGILTGCVGGIIRDLLAGDPSILLRPELYVTAAALSAALLVGLGLVGVPGGIAGIVAAAAGFTLRGTAIAKGISLPAYHR